MSEATPGPWACHLVADGGIGRTTSVYVCNDSGWPEGQLARVNVQDGSGEQVANARLIASAPDLLEALKGLTDIINSAESNASGNPEWEAVSKRVNAARAAIAKAEGRS